MYSECSFIMQLCTSFMPEIITQPITDLTSLSVYESDSLIVSVQNIQIFQYGKDVRDNLNYFDKLNTS